MMDLKLSKQDYENFGRAFLQFYLENGFGNKSKVDIDTKIFSLIIKSAGSFSLKMQAIKLGITPRKFNNLMLQANLRYSNDKNSEYEKKKELLDLLCKSKYGYGKEQELKFLLTDPVLRIYFEACCAEYQLITDTSFNKDIVIMSYKAFSTFLEKTYQNDIDAKILKKKNKLKGIGNDIFCTLPTVVQNLSGLVDLKDFSAKTAEYLTNMYLSFKSDNET